ncbi:MAG: hypothetical protein ABIO41_02970 [Ignavibacteria bacterium]
MSRIINVDRIVSDSLFELEVWGASRSSGKLLCSLTLYSIFVNKYKEL